MPRHRSAAAITVAMIVLAIAPITTATAQAPGDGTEVNSWALAPAGTVGPDAGGRTNLSYEVAPGAAVDDSVTLWNLGNTEQTFRVYATDAFNNDEGDFALLTGDSAPTDVGSWVKMAQESVTLPPGTQADVPLRFAVPADARPGDHAGAILASSQAQGQDSEGRIVALDRRTGARLYLRVAGPLRSTLVVENVRTTYHAAMNPLAGSVDVSYTVRNTGNVRLGTHQQVLVKNPFGRTMKMASGKDIAELLPGNAVTFRTHFSDVSAALRVTASVTLDPFPVGQPEGPAGPAVTGAGHGWAIPWSMLGLVLLLGLAWQAFRRYRAGNGPPTVPAGVAQQGTPEVH